ncbi:discoidin domain-containing protein, partial [Patescibacteria group bacterium]|nr:discoidin domain-containing protein [Patescibacteria group bacterium]
MKFKKPNLFLEKNFILLLIANFILLMGLFFFLGIVQKPQNFEKKAAFDEETTTSTNNLDQVTVLALYYLPVKDCLELNSKNKLFLDKNKASSNVHSSRPENAFDGDLIGDAWHVDPGNSQKTNYLQIELDNVETVRLVNLVHYANDSLPPFRIVSRIASSLTGEFEGEEKILVDESDNPLCEVYALGSKRMVRCEIPQPIKTKFIRLVIGDLKEINKQVSIYEMEVYENTGDFYLGQKKCYDLKVADMSGFESYPEMKEPMSGPRAKADEIIGIVRNSIKKGSAYHGYKDEQAQPSFEPYLYDKREYHEPVPERTTGLFRQFADQIQYLERENICDLVDNHGLKEVWTVMYHNRDGSMVPKESNQTMGKRIKQYWNYPDHGEASNDSYKENDLPICDNSYTVLEFSLERGGNDAVHSYFHQLENIFQFVDYDTFWGKFVGKKFHVELGDWICGNCHFPPQVPHSDYDYASSNTVYTSCEDWKPDGSGEVGAISCSNWNCDPQKASLAFYIWWMQNLPGKNNKLDFQCRSMINWWDYIVNFDEALLANNKSFYNDSAPVEISWQKGKEKKEALSYYSTSWAYGNRQKITIPETCINKALTKVELDLSYEGNNNLTVMISDEKASYPSRKEVVSDVYGNARSWVSFDFDYQLEPGKTYIIWLKKNNKANKVYWFSSPGRFEAEIKRNYKTTLSINNEVVPTLAPTLIPKPIPTITPTPTPAPSGNCPILCPAITSTSSGAGCFVKLSWLAVENAQKYYIYRNSNPESPNPYFKTTTAIEYIWNWLPCKNNSLYSVSAVVAGCPIKICPAV